MDYKPNYKIKNSRIIFGGKVFDLRVDEIEYESGNSGVREVAVHPGGAVVAALTSGNKIPLVKQFRYPFQKVLLELPAGKLDPGESPDHCAYRELKEETGYTAGTIQKLGSIYTTPGFCTEELHLFIATDLTAGDHKREEGEHGMEVFEYSLSEIENMITGGEIVDAKTISCIFLVKKFLNNK